MPPAGGRLLLGGLIATPAFLKAAQSRPPKQSDRTDNTNTTAINSNGIPSDAAGGVVLCTLCQGVVASLASSFTTRSSITTSQSSIVTAVEDSNRLSHSACSHPATCCGCCCSTRACCCCCCYCRATALRCTTCGGIRYNASWTWRLSQPINNGSNTEDKGFESTCGGEGLSPTIPGEEAHRPPVQVAAVCPHRPTVACTVCSSVQNLSLTAEGATLGHQKKSPYRCFRGVEAGADLLEGGGGEPPEAETAALPVIRKKEREYSGMLEYDKREEGAIIKMLIYDLKPRVAVTLLPGLPAYILFMCIRHTDHINDDEKVRSLLNHTVTGIKRVIKKRHQDLDSTVLWLSNTLRLLHNLKQYSGDKAFQQENSPKQSEQSLKNFDLSEYRQVLSDIAVWIYNGVIKLMEESIQPLVVPSILEHEAIAGLSGNKPGGMKGRKGSAARELESPVEPQKALDLLLAELTLFYRTLAMFGTDPELITQVFRQIFYFICAGALNNLLLRKDMCHWSKGMQIRYNLSHLEQWTRDMHLPELGNTDALSPIIQAAQLLQARKTDDDVDSICDMCDKLSVPQIVKILNLYTPDDFEERVPASFIQKIQQRLLERPNAEHEQATLIMNTKFSFPVRFPFNPSSIRLEDIELAEVLNLTMLRKV